MKTRLGIFAVAFSLCALFAWGQSFVHPTGTGGGGGGGGASGVETNAQQFGAAGAVLTLKDGVTLTNINASGLTNSAGLGQVGISVFSSYVTNEEDVILLNDLFQAPTKIMQMGQGLASSFLVTNGLTNLGPFILDIDRMTNGQTIIPIAAGPDFSITTSSNLTFVFSGTPNHGQRLSLSITNSGATNIAPGIPSAFSVQLGSGVTSWIVLASNYTRLNYLYSTNELTTGGLWRIDNVSEFEAAFAVTDGLALSTNASYRTVTLGNTWVASSNLSFSADNTYNIGGSSGVQRPANVYVGSTVYSDRMIPTNSIGGIQIGYLAGSAGQNTNGINIGSQTGQSASYSQDSVFVGWNAGTQATNIYSSVGVGLQAGYQATNAYQSVFLGGYSGYRASPSYGTVMAGYISGYLATNVNTSVMIGFYSGRQGNSLYGSTLIGPYAGYQATNAYFSLMGGNSAGYLATGPHNSIFLGREVGTNGTYNPYTLMIGNSQYGSLTNHLIYGEFDNRLLRVNGRMEITEGLQFNVWTNYVPATSNIVWSFKTNRYELRNQSIVVLTNIVELETGKSSDLSAMIHNTSGGNMYLLWPSYGATNGYYWQTNANNPNATTTIANNKKAVVSMTIYGTNVVGSLVLTE